MVVLTGSFLELSSTFSFLENEDDDEYERIGKRLCLKRNAWKSLGQRPTSFVVPASAGTG
jgi:hypothetical protein